MAQLKEIVKTLDEILALEAFTDSSHNGLQVENTGRISKVCCGVDATLPFFEEAQRAGADLVVCHHGISWGDSLKQITGQNYRLIEFLIRSDIALYACHLPLDAHAEMGNNARLARGLGLRYLKPFGAYHGQLIGFYGRLPKPVPWQTFVSRLERVTGNRVQSMPFGPEQIQRVGVISGGAAGEARQAAELGLDAYVSGEPALQAYHVAEQYGMHAFFAGHYATETFGVKAIGDFLAKRFGLKTAFLDLKIPF